MNKLVSFFAVLLLMAACQSGMYKYYHDVMDKPTTSYDYYADFVSSKVPENTVKSITSYKYIPDEIRFKSDDSILLNDTALFLYNTYKYNKKGQLIDLRQRFESYSSPKVYTFHYNTANQLACQTFSYNGYDTIYYLYDYNPRGDLVRELQLNNRRHEIGGFITRDIHYEPNAVHTIVNDYAHDTLLIFSWHNSVAIGPKSITRTRYRILLEDSSYNRFPDTAVYTTIRNQLRVSEIRASNGIARYSYTFYADGKLRSQRAGADSVFYNPHGDKELVKSRYDQKSYRYEYDDRGNWITRRCVSGNVTVELIKRQIDYYDTNSEDLTPAFELSAYIRHKADSLCRIIPSFAADKAARIQARRNDIDNGNYDTLFTVTQAEKLADFTPRYWTLVTSSTGPLPPYDTAVVAGYNTPIPTENEENEMRRCLAIFEKRGNQLVLRSQWDNALDPYFEDQTEAKSYELRINDNGFEIFYQYMHSEETINYEFDPLLGKWWRVSEWFTNRSYTNATSIMYDYKAQQLHFENYPLSDDTTDVEIDTLIHIEKQQPRIYLGEPVDTNTEDTVDVKGYGTVYF